MTEVDDARKTTRVFISYAWKDGAQLAQRLYEKLSGRCDPWKDNRRMVAGATWAKEIEHVIDATDVVVALVSPGANDSKVCGCERMRAFRKDKYIIPVLAVAGTDLPLELEGKIYRDLTGARPYDAEFELLLEDIVQRRSGAKLPERLRKTLVTAPALPFNYIARADVLKSLRESLIIDAARPSIAMTALQGMGGIGKTVLALGLAHDDVVQQAFPDGVIWVPVGKEPVYDLTTRLREVGKALGDDRTAYDGELSSINAYRTAMRDKAALIVLDDVWSVRDIEPFRVESPCSRLLFTTRDASLAESTGAKPVVPEFLTPEQSREMVARYSGLTVDALPAVADDLIRECGGLPLAIAMIGAMLVNTKDNPRSWQRIYKLLQEADLAEIERQFPDYPYPSLLRALQVSVDALDPKTRERYLALAVMREDAPVRPSIQQALWDAGEFDALGTAQKLRQLALAQLTGDDGSIGLHDLLLDYVQAQYPDREALGLIHEAMGLSSHAFDGDPAQFPSQLIARLLPYVEKPTVRSLLERIGAWQGALWLRPCSATLTPPGTTLVATLEEPGGGIKIVTISDDGETVAFAILDERNKVTPAIRVWRVGEETQTLPVSSKASALALSPDASRLAIALDDSAPGIAIWSLAAGAEGLLLYSFPTLGSAVVGLTFTGSCRLTTINRRGDIQSWDLGSSAPTLVGTVTLAAALEHATLFAFSHQAKKLFTNGAGTSTKVLSEWSVESGSMITHQLHGSSFRALTATPDGGTLVLGDLKIEIWRRTGQNFQLSRTLPGHGFILNGLGVTADGARVVSTDYRQIRVWYSHLERPNPKDARAENYIDKLAMRADGKEALAKYMDQSWKTIDVASRAEAPSGVLPADATLLATSYGGASDIFGRGKDLLVWDASAGRAQRTIISPVDGYPVAVTADRTRALTWTPDPKPEPSWTMALSEGKYVIWDIETGAVLARTKGTIKGHSLALFPDGMRMAAGMGNSVQIWDLQSGDLLRTLVGPTWFVDCLAVAVTPHGLRVVAGSRDKIVRVWDPERDEPLLTLLGHTYTISDVQFLPRGERFMSSAGDNTLRVWNLADERCEAVFTADAWILRCVPTPDGKTILAGDMAGNMHFLEFAGRS
jgi:WD40 repeat protein